MVRTTDKKNMDELIVRFAAACENSEEYQGHGWGISWLVDEKWNIYKSVKPIWEEKQQISSLPQANVFLVHARSASFEEQIGKISHNQPYLSGDLAFVSNIALKGVRLSNKIKGEVGARKVFTLINKAIKKDAGIAPAMRKVRGLIGSRSGTVEGFNLGICDGYKFYVQCQYEQREDYFTLNYLQTDDLNLVCSEKLSGFETIKLHAGEMRTI